MKHSHNWHPFLRIPIYLNICSTPNSNICLSFFNEKSDSRFKICIKNIQYNSLFRVSMSEPFSKNFFKHWWVWIFEYFNIITLEKFSYFDLCYLWRTNIFRYLFSKYVASKYIWIFIWYILWHPNIFKYSFVSILWYSLISARHKFISSLN